MTASLGGRTTERPDETAAWASEVLAATGTASPADVRTVRVLRGPPKRLAEVVLKGGGLLVLKQYRNRRGTETNRILQRLATGGLAPPSRFRVTRALGWHDAHLTQVAEHASGRDWGSWFDSDAPELRRASGAVADWIAALQGVTVDFPDRSGHRSAARLLREAGAVAESFPDWASDVMSLAEEASEVLSAGEHPLVASHGDLHLDEVFVTDEPEPVVTVVDLDTAGLRRPSDDVGFALAMLLVSSRMRGGTFSPGATAALAFWTRWAKAGRDREAVASQMVRSLLMSLHLELVVYQKRREDLLPVWLDLASTALSGGVDAALHRANEIG